MQARLVGARQRTKIDLDLAPGWNFERFLVFLLAVDHKFNHPSHRLRALSPDPAANLDRISLRGHARRWLGLLDRCVDDLRGGHAQNESDDPRALALLELLDLVEAFGRFFRVPGRPAEVCQNVDDTPRAVTLGDRGINLAHRGIERPVDRPDGQCVNSLQRLRGRPADRDRRLGRIDHEDQARIGQLAHDLASALLGFVEPRLVLLDITHRQARVEDEAQRRRLRSGPQGGLSVKRGPCQGQGHERHQRHPRQKQQPVLDPHPFLRPLLAFLDQP